jgi:RNA polymerase sigma-70 factor (ECF subfamily)
METCWTIIHGAAEGDDAARGTFAKNYEPVLRSYLAARWRGSPLVASVEDGVQEIFVECLKEGGLLERASSDRPGGFRAFLFGAALRVARRVEEGRGAGKEARLPSLFDVEDGESELTRIFDGAWARSMMAMAARRQLERAEALESPRRERALARVALLRDRFERDLPIREIAKEREADAKVLHDEYARAREEFRTALIDVVRFHGAPEGDVESRAAELVTLLRAT